jgi:ectoine hydrolase
MTSPAPGFDRAEYVERIAKTRAAMASRGLDLLVVTDPSNMAWLTGYDGWSFYVHQCVLLAMTGDPIWYGRAIPSGTAEEWTPTGPGARCS